MIEGAIPIDVALREEARSLHQPRFRLLPFANITLAATRSYLIKGILPREGLIVIWGAPKSGKTFWTFDLVMHVALGWGYRSRRVEQGTVVYVACEGERGLAARTEAFRRGKMSEASEAIVPFFLLSTRLDLVAERAELIRDIAAQLAEGDCAVIVLDTLNRSIRGSESDDADMGAYVRAADELREAFRCAVVIIHHCGISGDRPRGHTSLTGAADAQIAVKRNTQGHITTLVEWLKDGVEGDETYSALESIEVGTDEDGEAITSCVVREIEKTIDPERVRLTGAPKIAFGLLQKAIIEAGEAAPANNHIPPHVRVVDHELWRRYAQQGSLTDSDNPATQRKAFTRSVEKLQALGLIGIWSKWAWLVE